MEKKLKNVIGAPIGKTAVAHITHLETSAKLSAEEKPYGAFEWLRQLISHNRFYKRKDNFLVSIQDIFQIASLFSSNL
jgi:P-loop containing dynein motor region